MRDSTARSVSVTRSTAKDGYTLASVCFVLGVSRTILLVARGICGRFCGDNALSGLFSDGDHEVVDFLEVECHYDGMVVWNLEVEIEVRSRAIAMFCVREKCSKRDEL